MKQTAPLAWIELSRSALIHNLESLTKLAAGRPLAVSVKANAYGHGLVKIVGMLADRTDIEYLTVHSLEEAVDCRELGWTNRIMILGPIPHDCLDAVVHYSLEPVVFDLPTLSRLGKLGDRKHQQILTHLKLETGTNRQGITLAELPKFAEIYKRHRSLKRPYGASTHFANIEDTTQHDYAQAQLRNFKQITAEMGRLGIKPIVRHTAASAAMILFEKTRFDLVRPGIAMYGHWPSKETYLSYRLLGGENEIFRPVMSFKSRVTQIKDLQPDSFVGYGCTYRTTSRTRLAVVPVGYFDGYDRELSNKAYLLIKGKRAPVRGRVCMNLIMADVTDIKGVSQGEEVTLMGRSGSEEISAEQLAGWANSINYEILARLSPGLPRVVTR